MQTWTWTCSIPHDWVCLGKDTMNKQEKGICEVLVFACSRCGRDWRG